MKQGLSYYKPRLSVKIGNQLYYIPYADVMETKRAKPLNKIPTDKQYILRARFTEASRFAKAIISDPELKALYSKMAGDRCSAYNLAVAEYMLLHKSGQWVL